MAVDNGLFAGQLQLVAERRAGWLAKAEAANERHYRHYLAYHQGKDLVAYPDGLSMAAESPVTGFFFGVVVIMSAFP